MRHSFSLFMLGTLLVFLGVAFTCADIYPVGYTYSGTEAFQTEQDYTAFKDALVEVSANLDDVQVLSSTPPIITQFSIPLRGDQSFPYGTPSTHREPFWALAYSLVGIGGVMIIGYLLPPIRVITKKGE